MATKAPSKQSVETKPALNESVDSDLSAIAPDIGLEDAIADELLDSLDWGKVRSSIIRKASAKLFAWLVSSNDTPVNLSPYPELAALPSADEEEKAA